MMHTTWSATLEPPLLLVTPRSSLLCSKAKHHPITVALITVSSTRAGPPGSFYITPSLSFTRNLISSHLTYYYPRSLLPFPTYLYFYINNHLPIHYIQHYLYILSVSMCMNVLCVCVVCALHVSPVCAETRRGRQISRNCSQGRL